MSNAIIGFIFGVLVAGMYQESRHPQSRISRPIAIGGSIVFVLMFAFVFAFKVGKDLAVRDNSRDKTSNELIKPTDQKKPTSDG